MIIDAHHHLWHYNPKEFDWIDESMSCLARDFNITHLEKEMNQAGVEACVAVQARTTPEETRFLLDQSRYFPRIKAVVGWVDLYSDNLETQLVDYQDEPSLKGWREICQGQAEGFMLHPDFIRGVQHVLKQGYCYDILIIEKQLPEAIRFVDICGEGTFIVDHIAKPDIKHHSFQAW